MKKGKKQNGAVLIVIGMLFIALILVTVMGGGDSTVTDSSAPEPSASEQEDPTSIKTRDTAIFVIAKTIVKDNLKTPSTADFCGLSECTMQRYGDLYAATGYVDAENGFGAMIRSKWVVQFYSDDLRSYAYEATYIAIDDQEAGEWVDFPS